MTAWVRTGRMVKTSHLHQTGMKDLSIRMTTIAMVILVLVVAIKAIKASSLSHFLVKVDIVKVDVVAILVKAWTLKVRITTPKYPLILSTPTTVLKGLLLFICQPKMPAVMSALKSANSMSVFPRALRLDKIYA